jgi:hypothetical protein
MTRRPIGTERVPSRWCYVMSIPIHQLVVDRCYLTAQREIRHVLRIDARTVTYRTVRRSAAELPWAGETAIAGGKFAREALREVPRP